MPLYNYKNLIPKLQYNFTIKNYDMIIDGKIPITLKEIVF